MQARKTTVRAGDDNGASSEDDGTSRRDDGASSNDAGDYSPVVTDDSHTAEQESILRKLDQSKRYLSKRYLEGMACRPYCQMPSTSDSTLSKHSGGPGVSSADEFGPSPLPCPPHASTSRPRMWIKSCNKWI